MVFSIYALIAYILGSIPSALIIGKLFFKLDIRQKGSGNIGATNAFRILGIKAGIAVTLIDILKGTAATLIPILIGADVHPLLIGLFAVAGHTFPLFARFKGGKAVATSGGIILGVYPFLFVIMVLTFLVTLYLSKYVSLASMVTGIVTIILSFFIQDVILIVIISALTVFVFYRHKDNIKRIKNKTEPKITWM